MYGSVIIPLSCSCSVAQSRLTLCDPHGLQPSSMDYGSPVHGIIQARAVEWVAISSSRGFPKPGVKPMSPVSPALRGGFFPTKSPEKPNYSPLEMRKMRNISSQVTCSQFLTNNWSARLEHYLVLWKKVACDQEPNHYSSQDHTFHPKDESCRVRMHLRIHGTNLTYQY